jgi:UTP--glucose-1-phosphate uridylyltransferase
VYVVTRPGDPVVPAYVRLLQDDDCPAVCVPENLSCGYGNAAPLLTLRPVLEACAMFIVAFGDDVLLGAPPPARTWPRCGRPPSTGPAQASRDS